MKDRPQPARARVAPLGRSLKAIGWAFLGIRKNTGHGEDTAGINPLHLVAIAFVAVLLLVLGLIALVRWVAVPG